MTILIIGGTGNTGLPLAKLLHDAGCSALLTTRSGVVPEPYKGVSFDWFEPSTYNHPFDDKNTPDGTPIDRIYIVGPLSFDPMPFAKPFIDLAISKGVKKFVLLSGTLTPPGAPFSGKVHEYLEETPEIDFVVLRATWFMQNFEKHYRPFIKSGNHIFSGVEDGKIPFVSCEDIAQAAFEALTSDEPVRRDIFVVGPQLLAYDEVVSILSNAVGRPISHMRLTKDKYEEIFRGFGIPDDWLSIFVEREWKARANAEVDSFSKPEEAKYVGKRTLEEYFNQNAEIWK